MILLDALRPPIASVGPSGSLLWIEADRFLHPHRLLHSHRLFL